MPELIAKPRVPTAPITHAGTTLTPFDPGAITRLTLRRGKDAGALKSAHGLAFPAPNRATGRSDQRAIWVGPDQVLLLGPTPDPTLAEAFALVDQTDGYAAITASGPTAPDLFARLIPLDLRDSRFKRGHSAATLLRHIPLSLSRIGAASWLLLVPGSMAASALHDLDTAGATLAARLDLRR